MHNKTTQEGAFLAGVAGISPSLRTPAFRHFAIAVGVLILCFSKPLYDLVRLALKQEIHSHILLIPMLSAYLVWIKRSELPVPSRQSIRTAILPLICASLSLFAVWMLPTFGVTFHKWDRLTLIIAAFYCLFVALVLQGLGAQFSKAIAFPLAFLFFIIPLPEALIVFVENALMKASADVFSFLLWASQAPYFREGQVFALPGLTIKVAQECSGIRSSFVLFLTALLAGHMFLRTGWRKGIIALCVFPLGIFRNAFRIYVLSMLTIHWDAGIIDGPLHHQGGPFFFAISLIPFFLILFWFRKSEAECAPVVGSDVK